MLIALIIAVINFALVWTLVNYYLPIDARFIRIHRHHSRRYRCPLPAIAGACSA
jgi:hypothetical protein